MIRDLYEIRNLLASGKSIYDLPLKVTFYARVSTDRDEQLNSLENQIMYFKTFIKEQSNWTYVNGYIDEGISGTSVKKRDNFNKMIADGKAGKFNLILTKEISRFSRNTVDSIRYTQELLRNGIGVYFLNDNINTYDQDSELRLTIMSSIAQDEIRKLSERVKFGYKRSLERGIVAGSNNITGYKKNKGKLEILEDESRTILLIFVEYGKDIFGTTRLGFYLYEKYGIKSKTGKPLAGAVIARIIRNPKYKGYYCGHIETVVDYISKKRIRFSRDEWVVYKDNEACPPIVSEELWDKCNEILDRRSNNYKQGTRTDSRYALSGKIKCYHDGATFTKGCWKSKTTGYERKYWGCANYRKNGKAKTDGCKTPVIRYEELLDIFKKIVKVMFNNKSKIMSDIYSLINDEKNNKDYTNEINKINNEIDQLKSFVNELIDMKLRKEISSDEYTRNKEKYNEKIELLEKQKDKYLEIEDNVSAQNIEEFSKNIENIILSDDESVFSILAPIIDTIYVERMSDDEKNKDVMLHFKLNVTNDCEIQPDLDNFLLLFSNSEGYGSSEKEVIEYRRKSNNKTAYKNYNLRYHYKIYV